MCARYASFLPAWAVLDLPQHRDIQAALARHKAGTIDRQRKVYDAA
jgi:hypothetical protein